MAQLKSLIVSGATRLIGKMFAQDIQAESVVVAADPTQNLQVATKQYVDNIIISGGGEINQNAFSNVKVGSTTVAADTKTDTLELVAGTNVTLTPDATNDKITITATDTTYTAATAAPGNVASSSSAGTSTNYARQDHTHGITLATGDSNGQVKIAGSNVSVKGWNTAATYDVETTVANDAKLPTGAAVKSFVEGKGYVTTDTNTRRAFYGTCATAAATKDKVVTLSDTTGWELLPGTIVCVKFTYTNTYANATDSPITLNVNNTGAKNIWYNTTHSGAGNTGAATQIYGVANRHYYYMYDGTYWVWINYGVLDGNSNTIPTAYSTTAADTAAKTASCTNYNLLAKSYTILLISTTNTKASALTLNINSKGAKPLYINGSASSASNHTMPAGSYLVYYDGTNYYIRTDGKITGDITGDAATVNGHTIATDVPASAVFTDTTYTAGAGLSLSGTEFSANLANNLTTTVEGSSLDARQGPIIAEQLEQFKRQVTVQPGDSYATSGVYAGFFPSSTKVRFTIPTRYIQASSVSFRTASDASLAVRWATGYQSGIAPADITEATCSIALETGVTITLTIPSLTGATANRSCTVQLTNGYGLTFS